MAHNHNRVYRAAGSVRSAGSASKVVAMAKGNRAARQAAQAATVAPTMAQAAANVAAQAAQAGSKAVAVVAGILATVCTFARYHTRGAVAMCSYHVAGVPGIVFAHCHLFGAGVPPQTLQFTAATPATPVPAGNTLLAYRGAVAGGKLGRSSYGASGLRGTFTVCNTLFCGQLPPPALLVNVALAQPQAAAAGTATSAKVAAANVAQAAAAGTAVAKPAQVAQVAQAAGAAVVAAVASGQPSSASVAAGKAAAAAVLANMPAKRQA